MKINGKIKEIKNQFENTIITFSIPKIEENNLEVLSKIIDKKINVDLKVERNKRSLNANAYMWELLQKMSEVLHTSKEELYIQELQKYSRAFTHIVVKPNAVEEVKKNFRTCIELGEITINGQKGVQLQLYYGSSTFDTKEMSVLIDGIVSDCKELSIETLPKEEIELLKNMWNK